MCGSRPGPTGRSPASSQLAARDAPGTLDLNKLGDIGRALLRGSTRRGSAAWLTRTPTRFYERNDGVRIGGSPSDAGSRPPAPAG